MGQVMWQPEFIWVIQGERVYCKSLCTSDVPTYSESLLVTTLNLSTFRVGGLKSPRSDIPFCLSSVGVKNKNNPLDIKKRQGEH